VVLRVVVCGVVLAVYCVVLFLSSVFFLCPVSLHPNPFDRIVVE